MTYEDTTLGKVIDGGGERVPFVCGPLVEGSREGAESDACDNVDHEMTDEIETID